MNLQETVAYAAGIYQLETTDLVVGGPDGVANLQAKQLANRTAWLKSRIDALEAGETIPATVAPLESPALSGEPTAPTAPPHTDSGQIATCAFVMGELAAYPTAAAVADALAGYLPIEGGVLGESLAIPNGTLAFGARTAQHIDLYGDGDYGIGVQSFRTYFRTAAGFAWFLGGSHAEATDEPGAGGSLLMKLTDAGLAISADGNGGTSCALTLSGAFGGGLWMADDGHGFGSVRLQAGNMVLVAHDAAGATTGSASLTPSGLLSATGGVQWSSDARLKTGVRDFALSFEQLASLQSVQYERIANGRHEVGGIAQNIEQVLPDCVSDDGHGMKGVDFGRAAYVAVVSLVRHLEATGGRKRRRCAPRRST